MEVTDFDPSSPHLVAGERLGVWRLQRTLGTVPSGTWWRAGHAMGPQAALVLVYADARDAAAVLLRTAQAEGQPWKHADVAWPLDSGLTPDGRPYVVMPLLDGEPLAVAVATAPLRRRLDWALQLCELLLLAQAQGLALVELDPSLLWIGPQQQLRLHALALVPRDAKAERLGSLQGHVSLAAQPLHCPASLQGVPGGAPAQVFAVGVLLCWLVNGRWPHETQPSAAATVQALSQWVSLPPTARAALDELLRAAVHPTPAERPAGLEALGQAIADWLDQTGAATGEGPSAPAAEVPSPAPKTPGAVPVVPTAEEPRAVPAKAEHRRPYGVLLLLALLGAVALVATLTWAPLA